MAGHLEGARRSMNAPAASLIEVYSSLQGEGPYTGEPMLFVRFQNCALSCRFCDTPASFKKLSEFRREEPWRSGRFVTHPSPISAERLSRLVESSGDKFLSLTGGEPLQQDAFLEYWLPQIRGPYRILLESNGVLPRALQRVVPHIDIISMDIKLPSVTGMAGFWEEHREFLRIAKQKEVYVKVVVSAGTDRAELARALALVREEAAAVPFVLQPVTPYGPVREGIGKEQLKELVELSRGVLGDVRIMPQMHPLWGIL
jgi:organic radical activating enzyme